MAAKRFVIIDAEAAENRDAMAERLSADPASPAAGAVVITMGHIREELYGIPRTATLPEGALSPEIEQACKKALIERTAKHLRAGDSVIVAANIKYDAIRSYMMGFGFAFDYKVSGFVLDKEPGDVKHETEYRSDALMKKYWRDITAAQAPEKAYAALRDALKETDTKRTRKTKHRPKGLTI